jgi:DNA-binding GntR family transcriptional regulator
VVLKPDLELARSTYQFRTIIERAAARHCATAGDVTYFARVIEEHKDLIKVIEGGNFDDDVLVETERLERSLHDGMLNTLDNLLVTTTARRLKNYVQLIRLERIITPPLILQSLNEHLAILDAITKRDGKAADAALALHFQASLQRILGMF